MTTTDHLAHPPVVLQPIRESEGEAAWEVCELHLAQAWRVFTYPDGAPHIYNTRSMAMLAVECLCLRKPAPEYGKARRLPRTVYLP